MDLAEHAARRVAATGVAAEDVDFIAFGTTTPDLIFPNCGVLLQSASAASACRPSAWKPPAPASCTRSRSRTSTCAAGSQAGAGDQLGDALAHHRLVGSLHRHPGTDGAGAVVLELSDRGDSLDAPARMAATTDALLRGGVSRGFSEARDPHGRQEVFRSPLPNLGRWWMKPGGPGWTARRSTGWCRTGPTSASSRPPPPDLSCRSNA